jgi:hypothetical protein
MRAEEIVEKLRHANYQTVFELAMADFELFLAAIDDPAVFKSVVTSVDFPGETMERRYRLSARKITTNWSAAQWAQLIQAKAGPKLIDLVRKFPKLSYYAAKHPDLRNIQKLLGKKPTTFSQPKSVQDVLEFIAQHPDCHARDFPQPYRVWMRRAENRKHRITILRELQRATKSPRFKGVYEHFITRFENHEPPDCRAALEAIIESLSLNQNSQLSSAIDNATRVRINTLMNPVLATTYIRLRIGGLLRGNFMAYLWYWPREQIIAFLEAFKISKNDLPLFPGLGDFLYDKRIKLD